MKWQWILWAVYLVIISFVPCSEGDEVCVAGTSTATEQTTPPCKDPGAGDHCSPFCCCFCCQAQCTAQIFSRSSIPFIQTEPASNTGYIESLHPVYCGNIWQPPKISIA